MYAFWTYFRGTTYGKKLSILNSDDADAILLKRSLEEKELPPNNTSNADSDSDCSVIEIPEIEPVSNGIEQRQNVITRKINDNRPSTSKEMRDINYVRPSTSKEGLNNNGEQLSKKSKTGLKRRYSVHIDLDDSANFDVDHSPVKKMKGQIESNGIDVEESLESVNRTASDRMCMQVNASGKIWLEIALSRCFTCTVLINWIIFIFLC